VAIGVNTLAANTTGWDNTAVGTSSLAGNTIGYGNTAIGSAASSGVTGSNNVVIGKGAAVTGNRNIVIGVDARLATTSENSIVIGTTAYTSQYAPSATWAALSDCRDKTGISGIPVGLDFIKEVKPVQFTWATRDGNRSGVPDSGFLAQDLLELIKKYGVQDHIRLAHDANPEQLYADPGKLMPIMVKAIQDLDIKIYNLEQQLEILMTTK
jgi:hypothetical protein